MYYSAPISLSEKIDFWECARQLSPNSDHRRLITQARALYRLGKYEKAIASFDKALEIKPDNPEAWYYRGNALYNLERYKEAIASYDKAVEIKPDYHKAWNMRNITEGRRYMI